MKFQIETECEVDGRWIAEIPNLSGVMAYGVTKQEAIAKAEALALRVLADRIEYEKKPIEQPAISCYWPSVKARKVYRALLELAGLRKTSKALPTSN